MSELRAFVANNPFPSYDKMMDYIDNHPQMQLGMAMYAEYGKFNHECLKAIYDSGMDTTIAHEMGQKIYNAGGLQAMQMNYYVFNHYSPFSKSRNQEIYYTGSTILQYLWDGIGDWQR